MYMFLILIQITGKKFKQVTIDQDQDVDTQLISLKVNCMFSEGMTAN
jgi:hypothetical protein